MIGYIIKRVAYAFPILVGINLITFFLFFVVNSPDQMARLHLGVKRVSSEAILKWKVDNNYHLPKIINTKEEGLRKVTQTIFFQKSAGLFLFEFGSSDEGRDISYEIKQRIWPSLALSIPTFIVGLFTTITFAMGVAYIRGSSYDLAAMVLCIIGMSISSLFYIIVGQFLFGKVLRLVPISGYESGFSAFKFLITPVLIGIVGGLGGQVRWYRTLFLEEIEKNFVKTARSKGLDKTAILFKHILPNALIPILTGIVVVIPLLFMGSLIMESFFGIPGLGSFTINAIKAQDFSIVRAMVFLGSVLYITGLILTDIMYSWVDPRVRME